MINVIAKLFSPANLGAIEALAGQVADSSKSQVCELVCDEVQGMSLSEARGYVRARAAGIVRKQARIAISRQAEIEQDWADRVARTATERIVPWVLRQAAVGRPRTAVIRLAA